MADAVNPNRLQPDTPLKDNLALVNDNFDKTVQAINDIGGKKFNQASYSYTVAAGATFTFSVQVVDTRNIYVAGSTPINPVIKIYVDNDLDDTYILGYGSALPTNTPHMVSVWSFNGYLTPPGGLTGNVADYTIQTHNFDVASHTYYSYLNTYAFQTPSTGIFR